MFRKEYAEVFEGTPEWKAIHVDRSDTYDWQDDSTYIRLSPFFDEMGASRAGGGYSRRAHSGHAGRFVTTDHISPAGASKPIARQAVICKATASSGAILTPTVRRGNHEVMMRGTFANIRIRNEMVPGVEGG
jgi:aconitate hydratase